MACSLLHKSGRERDRQRAGSGSFTAAYRVYPASVSSRRSSPTAVIAVSSSPAQGIVRILRELHLMEILGSGYERISTTFDDGYPE